MKNFNALETLLHDDENKKLMVSFAVNRKSSFFALTIVDLCLLLKYGIEKFPKVRSLHLVQ